MGCEKFVRSKDGVTRQVLLEYDEHRVRLEARYSAANEPERSWQVYFDRRGTDWKVLTWDCQGGEWRPAALCLVESQLLFMDVRPDAFGTAFATLAGWPEAAPKGALDWPAGENWLLSVLCDVSDRIHGLFEPAAREAAARFTVEARLPLVERFTRDATGRLFQLVDKEPGVLLLMTALRGLQPNEPAGFDEDIFRGIQDGEPLNKLIMRSLERFLRRSVEGQVPTDPAVRRAMVVIDGLPPSQRAQRMKQWRLLVRRAGPLVTPALLLRPPPLALVPEEIPKEPEENAAWYKAMASHDGIISAAVAGSESLGHRLSRALSRHPKLGRQSGFLLRYLEAHPEMSLLDVDTRQATRKLLIYRMVLHRKEMALGPPPFAGIDVPGLRVVPLETVTALQRESKEMTHCAEGYADAVKAGHCYLYAAWVGEERLTVELQPGDDRVWRIVQVKGPSNVRASTKALKRLATWCPLHVSWGAIEPLEPDEPPRDARQMERRVFEGIAV